MLSVVATEIFVMACYVSSQMTQTSICEEDNPVCSQQGEIEELRLAIQRVKKDFDDVNTNDCADLYMQGHKKDGVYTIRPKQLTHSIQVYCDQTEDGGGWTKLLRRQDGSVDFTQTWDIYKKGFGSISGEHWLGNDNMAALTRQRLYKLRVRLWDWDGNTRYADYSSFVVEPEWDKYRLHIGVYTGDAGDSLSYHDNQKFTTIDADHDHAGHNCAQEYVSGNWFNLCYQAGLTNIYKQTGNVEQRWQGVMW